jgi:hypothetical protein
LAHDQLKAQRVMVMAPGSASGTGTPSTYRHHQA